MAYDFDYDYDYSEDVINDAINDAIVDSIEEERKAARQRAGAADYSGVVSAIGNAIGDIYKNYGAAIGPSTTGYYGDDYTDYSGVDTYNYGATDDVYDYDNIDDIVNSIIEQGYSDLYASNTPGVADSSTSYESTQNDDYGYGYSDEDVAAYIASLGSNGTETGGTGTQTEGGGTQTDGTGTETGIFGGTLGPKLKNMFGGLLGILGLGGGNFLNTILGQRQGGGFGTGNPLLDFLMMKSLMKDDKQGYVPVGGEAYGGQAFNYQDYQPTNLQPALMPGVAYANVGAPGMMGGGEAKQYPNKGLAALAKEAPEVVKRMGYKDGGSIMNRPGDITFAKLEPGEFVIRREAVDAVGIPTLEQINSMGG